MENICLISCYPPVLNDWNIHGSVYFKNIQFAHSMVYIVHSRRKILVSETTDLKYLRESTRLKSRWRNEVAGYYRPRETKGRIMLVEAYRKKDLINGEYKCTN